jgi:hypothetical protein
LPGYGKVFKLLALHAFKEGDQQSGQQVLSVKELVLLAKYFGLQENQTFLDTCNTICVLLMIPSSTS